MSFSVTPVFVSASTPTIAPNSDSDEMNAPNSDSQDSKLPNGFSVSLELFRPVTPSISLPLCLTPAHLPARSPTPNQFTVTSTPTSSPIPFGDYTHHLCVSPFSSSSSSSSPSSFSVTSPSGKWKPRRSSPSPILSTREYLKTVSDEELGRFIANARDAMCSKSHDSDVQTESRIEFINYNGIEVVVKTDREGREHDPSIPKRCNDLAELFGLPVPYIRIHNGMQIVEKLPGMSLDQINKKGDILNITQKDANNYLKECGKSIFFQLFTANHDGGISFGLNDAEEFDLSSRNISNVGNIMLDLDKKKSYAIDNSSWFHLEGESTSNMEKLHQFFITLSNPDKFSVVLDKVHNDLIREIQESSPISYKKEKENQASIRDDKTTEQNREKILTVLRSDASKAALAYGILLGWERLNQASFYEEALSLADPKTGKQDSFYQLIQRNVEWLRRQNAAVGKKTTE